MSVSGAVRAGKLAATAALVFAGLCARARAADPPDTPMLTQWMRSGRFQVALVEGRFSLGTRHAFGSTSSRSSGGERSEQITIQATGTTLTLNYELSVAPETYSVQVKADGSLEVRRAPKPESGATAVELVQEPGKAVVLRVGEGQKQQVFEAPSVWHLALAHPEPVRDHVGPLLRPLMPEANLPATAGALEARMVQLAAAQRPPDRPRWEALVAQLGDDKYARREAADRALREAGPSVLAFLRNLDPGTLDAEQQFRIRRIIQALSRRPESDTAESVAEWLLTDARAWLLLLDRPDESTRRAAAGRLEVLLGQPTGFDPAADPATRRQQIERLRARMAGLRDT